MEVFLWFLYRCNGDNITNLNLGCGKDIRKGWVNLDKYDLDGVDIVFDLDKKIWDFSDFNEYSYIYASHVIEHIEDTVKFINETCRILKDGGVLELIYPIHYKNMFIDITHKRYFNYNSYKYFLKDFKYNYYLDDCGYKLISKHFYRSGSPFWHLEKYFNFSIPKYFAYEIKVILENVK